MKNIFSAANNWIAGQLDQARSTFRSEIHPNGTPDAALLGAPAQARKQEPVGLIGPKPTPAPSPMPRYSQQPRFLGSQLLR